VDQLQTICFQPWYRRRN